MHAGVNDLFIKKKGGNQINGQELQGRAVRIRKPYRLQTETINKMLDRYNI